MDILIQFECVQRIVTIFGPCPSPIPLSGWPFPRKRAPAHAAPASRHPLPPPLKRKKKRNSRALACPVRSFFLFFLVVPSERGERLQPVVFFFYT